MLYIPDVFFNSQFRVSICCTLQFTIRGCYFSKVLYKKYMSLYLVFNYASSFIPFYNDYIFIVYFTLRSAFNTISTEREKLKQLMEQDVSSSPSAQVIGLKHALSSVSCMSVSQRRLTTWPSWGIFLYFPIPWLCWKFMRKPNKLSKFYFNLVSDLLILNTQSEPTSNLRAWYFIEH